MKILRKVSIVFGFALGVLGCETDFEINAPYQETTIVYGLLDLSENKHFLKINKTFLGEGNALDFAQIADSSQYSELNAVVREWKNGNIQNTYALQDTVVEDKESGIFYYPNQTVYFFDAALDEDSEYEVFIELPDREVSARTSLVNNFNISKPNQATGKVSFARINSSIDGNYPEYDIEWNSATNARRYEIMVRFNYWEVQGSDTVAKTIDWNLGTVKSTTAEGGESLQKVILGENFYKIIADRIEPDDNLDARIIGELDFFFTLAGEDLNTYMEVNEPVSGIVQERPEFTNVSNGLGLFSSRFNKSVVAKQLTSESVRELAIGQYTGDLGFCSRYPEDDSQSYACQ